MPLPVPSLRTAALALALASAILAPPAAAQRSAEDARVIEAYRLTMPVLRKVLPALNAAPACGRDRQRDPHSLGIAEMTGTLEGCAPVSAALRRAGVAPRAAAIVFGSMLRTAQAVALRSGDARALPAGPLRDNALLIEANDAELRQLARTGGAS